MINSRDGLIEYAMRKLGSPVIAVEVDISQVEDRVDEALQFFQDFHYDATERMFLKHQITGTTIRVTDTTGWVVGETARAPDGTNFTLVAIESGKFITRNVYSAKMLPGVALPPGTVLTGQTSGSVTTVIVKTAGDTETSSVPVSEMVTGVVRVLPWSGGNSTRSDNYMFDPQYQLIVNNFQNLTSTGMIYYSQLQSHLSLLRDVLNPIDSIRFNKKMNRVHIDADWSNMAIGSFLIFDCFRILDPEVFTDIYNDRMLKKLVTAKVKYQWATNTQKYEGIQLLGGVTINASTLMAQAVAEIEAIETEIRDSFEIPAIGFLA